jgi:hypothetical protein
VVLLADLPEVPRIPTGDFDDDDDETGGQSAECGFTCPLGQYAQIVYKTGAAPVGVVIRRTAESTDLLFTGLVALYVPAQSVIALVLYEDQPLSGIGTVLTAISSTLAFDDVLRIEASESNSELYRVKVSGITVIQRTIDNAQLSVVNPCVCVVQIGAVGPIDIPEDEDSPMIIVQAADQSVTNDTLVDSDLVLAMEANATYCGHVAAKMSSASSTPDAKYKFTGPALCEGLFMDIYWVQDCVALDEESARVAIAGGGNAQLHINFTVRNGANAGSLTFQFSQFGTNATATTLNKDSHMMMFKQA